MADEKKTVKEIDEGKKAENKFVAFIKNLPQRIATPFKNMWHELKKVTWPTKKDLINYTCIVLLFMVFMGVVIGLLDMGASKLVTAISSVRSTDTADTADDSVIIIDDDATVEDDAQTVQDDAAQETENTETSGN